MTKFVVLLAFRIVLIKSINGKKKLAENTALKLKVTAKRKGTALNLNHRLIDSPMKSKQLREAWIKAVRREPLDKKRVLVTISK